ncbi:MAG: cystathionine gamma-synthase [Myxococcota bacterium]|nr:cystathionine gamma-synthase [Myxococcota bacterium]
MKLDTLAIHAGQAPDPSTGAIMPPVYQTSTYVQSSPGEHQGYEYSRSQNPTREALERNLAALEGAAHGLAFGSGCAASTTVMHLLPPGAHVVCGDDVYGGTFRLFDKVLSQRNITYSFVDLTRADALEEHIRPETAAVWIETPTNPMMKIVDIEHISTIAHKNKLLVFTDNTFASPIFQNPLALGADVVIHSTTKFINGHSDVVGGFVGTNNDELGERLRFLQNSIGAVPGPWDCWLTLRGIKTLPLRMRRHDESGRKLAHYLHQHSDVKTVYYPGLPSHPQHEIAKRQMRGFGGMISFVLNGDLDRAKLFLRSLRIFALAESLGGVESLAEHPAIMTHASVPAELRQELGIHDGLIRLSVGIEDVGDLQSDLERAFQTSSKI